jgi:hypothetical protein
MDATRGTEQGARESPSSPHATVPVRFRRVGRDAVRAEAIKRRRGGEGNSACPSIKAGGKPLEDRLARLPQRTQRTERNRRVSSCHDISLKDPAELPRCSPWNNYAMSAGSNTRHHDHPKRKTH